MNREERIIKCRQLLEITPVAYLTTVDEEGYPQTCAMLNLRDKNEYARIIPLYAGHDEDFLVYFTTCMDSPKIQRIQKQPKASVYFCDAHVYHGFMVSGLIEIVTDPFIKETIWDDNWINYYYPGGLNGPEYGVLSISPTCIKGWWENETFSVELNTPK